MAKTSCRPEEVIFIFNGVEMAGEIHERDCNHPLRPGKPRVFYGTTQLMTAVEYEKAKARDKAQARLDAIKERGRPT